MDEFSSALSGGLAGAISSFLTYPLDTILVRYQSKYSATNNNSRPTDGHNHNNNDYSDSNRKDCSPYDGGEGKDGNKQTAEQEEGRLSRVTTTNSPSDQNINNNNADNNNNNNNKTLPKQSNSNNSNNNKGNKDIYHYHSNNNNKSNRDNYIKSSKDNSVENMFNILLFFLNEKKKKKNFAEVCEMYNGVSFKMVESLTKNFIFFYWHIALKKAYEKRMGRITAAANMMLATTAGILSLVVTAPMEVITTNLQTSQMSLKKVVTSIFQKEGVRGFYRGLTASIILCSNPAITNSTFDYLKTVVQLFRSAELGRRLISSDDVNKKQFISQFDNRLPPLTALQSFSLGAVAKAVATVITYPYIRTKVFVQARVLRSQQRREEMKKLTEENNSTNTSDVNERTDPEADVYRQESRIYNNRLMVNASRNLNNCNNSGSPNSLCNYDSVNSFYTNHPSPSALLSNVDLLKPASFCLSDISEAVPYLVEECPACPPLSRMPGPPLRRIDSTCSESDKGIIGVLVSTVMQEGLGGLYRGLKLQLIKTVVASAILYMIKEKLHAFTKNFLRFLLLLFKKRKKLLKARALRMFQ